MSNAHRVAMLGTGLIGDFYTMTLHGQRNRDRVHVIYSRSRERAEAFARDNDVPEWSTDLEEVLGATLADVFPTVLRDPAEDTNTLLIATTADGGAAKLVDAIPRLPEELRPRARQAVARIGPRLEGGTVYTDDRAPVEWLIDASIVEVAARGER